MWASHIAHHQSEEFNLSTALRQTGTDYIGFVFYIPLYLAGVPAAAVITVGSLNLIYQFWVHTEHIRRLGPLEWIFVTPSNHRVHHARNPEYIDRNYGGVFILWDRMFGTFKDERADMPCVYGITTGLKSWNPLWANLHFWSDTAKLAWRTRSWGDKLRIWFKPPGWYPSDLDPHEKRRSELSEVRSADERYHARLHIRAVLGPDVASLWLLQVEKTTAARVRSAGVRAGCASRCSCRVRGSRARRRAATRVDAHCACACARGGAYFIWPRRRLAGIARVFAAMRPSAISHSCGGTRRSLTTIGTPLRLRRPRHAARLGRARQGSRDRTAALRLRSDRRRSLRECAGDAGRASLARDQHARRRGAALRWSSASDRTSSCRRSKRSRRRRCSSSRARASR